MARAAWKELRQKLIFDICNQKPPRPTLSLVQRSGDTLQRLGKVQEVLRNGNRNAFEDAKLASVLDLEGKHLDAKHLLEQSIEKEGHLGKRSAMHLLKHMVQRHVQWQQEREDLGRRQHKVVAVETVSANISREELWERFVQPGIPCVLRGVRLAPFRHLQDLKAVIGHLQVPLRRCDEDSTNWAKLESAGTVSFEDFLKSFVEPFPDGISAPQNSPQLFDFSIWQQCAETLDTKVHMPSKWFPVDLYSYASAQIQPVSGSAGPTLFVAPQGSGSSLHVDTLQTNFWMSMCRGQKRWRLVSKDEISLLHPLYLTDLNPVFPADLNSIQNAATKNFTETKFIGHRSVTIHETVLEADDLIFVPAGWPHQVENLETSIAVSANFIDASNIQKSLEEAEILGNVEEDPGILAKILRSVVASDKIELLTREASENESLRKFKARHGETRAPYEFQRLLLRGISISAIGIGCICLVFGLRGRGRSFDPSHAQETRWVYDLIWCTTLWSTSNARD